MFCWRLSGKFRSNARRTVPIDFLLSPSWICGRARLPSGIDPCGENGEFHTVVSAGPMFAAPIGVHVGETVERDGFVYG